MKTKLLLLALLVIASISISRAQTAPLVPTITVINATTGGMIITFTAGSDGGSAITGYKYSTDGGATWATNAAVASPFTITTLSATGPFVAGTAYSVAIKAVNVVGDGAASGNVSQTYISLSGGGNGTAGNPFKIATAADLNSLKGAITASSAANTNSNYFLLTQDIDCSSYLSGLFYGGIGNSATNAFKANFDGAGHKVYGLVAASALPASATTRLSSATTGFFLSVSGGATISNLWVDVNYYTASTSTSGTNGVVLGGLVGTIAGNATINNCKVTGIIDSETTSSSTAAGRATAGGIVGTISAASSTINIINCSVNATVSTKNSFSTGGTTAAGIVGQVWNQTQTINIVNCLAAGSVTSWSVGGAPSAAGISTFSSITSLVAAQNIVNCMATNSISTIGVNIGYNVHSIGITEIPAYAASVSTIKNCIAFNPLLSAANNSATTPNVLMNRVTSSTLIATTNIDANYAKANMTLLKMLNPAVIYSTYNLTTPAEKAVTGKDGADINTIGEGVTKLNDYVIANPKYPATTGTDLKSWPTSTLSLATSSVSYNGSAQAAIVNSSVAGSVTNVKYDNSSTAPTNVGSYVVTADFQPTNVSTFSSLSVVVGTYTITTTVPNAPTSVTATAGNTQASVAFTAPLLDGGSAILDYTVTPYDGTTAGTPVIGSASPIVVTGLTNGTAYTFTVTARNIVGSSATATSSSVTPSATTGVDNQKIGKSVNYEISNGILKVKGIEGSKQLSIYSISGAICKQLTVCDSYSTSLAKGIYILKVDSFAASKLVVY